MFRGAQLHEIVIRGEPQIQGGYCVFTTFNATCQARLSSGI